MLGMSWNLQYGSINPWLQQWIRWIVHTVCVCGDLLWLNTDQFYTCSAGFLHKHWGNYTIVPVPVKKSCKIWVYNLCHYNDVIMGEMASQITGVTIVYPNICSGADQRKHQSSVSLAFVWGIHRSRVNSPQRTSNAENVSIWWRHHDSNKNEYSTLKPCALAPSLLCDTSEIHSIHGIIMRSS